MTDKTVKSHVMFISIATCTNCESEITKCDICETDFLDYDNINCVDFGTQHLCNDCVNQKR